MTLLAPLAPKIALLVVLVFFASLTLVGRRLLVLATRYISKRNINELSPFGVFSLFFRRLIPLGTLKINLPGFCG